MLLFGGTRLDSNLSRSLPLKFSFLYLLHVLPVIVGFASGEMFYNRLIFIVTAQMFRQPKADRLH